MIRNPNLTLRLSFSKPIFIMPRFNQSPEGFINGGCKIRKRGCSSSTSSSLLQSNRYKRAILIRGKGASTKPVPMWRMNGRSPSSSGRISDSSWCRISNYGCSGTQATVSARKLANALWEMSRNSSALEFEKLKEKIAKREKSGDYKLKRSIEVISPPRRPSDEGHSPVLVVSVWLLSLSQWYIFIIFKVSDSSISVLIFFCWL